MRGRAGPASVQAMNWSTHSVSLELTHEQLQNGPAVDTARPVSRQREIDLYERHGYPNYWTGPYLWGYSLLPGLLEQTPLEDPARKALRGRMESERSRKDPHLRSAGDVIGYDVQAEDGPVGHIDDLLFDAQTWRVESVVVNTRNWRPGKKVAVSPDRITRISWGGKVVAMDISRLEFEHGMEYERECEPEHVPAIRQSRAAHLPSGGRRG